MFCCPRSKRTKVGKSPKRQKKQNTDDSSTNDKLSKKGVSWRDADDMVPTMDVLYARNAAKPSEMATVVSAQEDVGVVTHNATVCEDELVPKLDAFEATDTEQQQQNKPATIPFTKASPITDKDSNNNNNNNDHDHDKDEAAQPTVTPATPSQLARHQSNASDVSSSSSSSLSNTHIRVNTNTVNMSSDNDDDLSAADARSNEPSSALVLPDAKTTTTGSLNVATSETNQYDASSQDNSSHDGESTHTTHNTHRTNTPTAPPSTHKPNKPNNQNAIGSQFTDSEIALLQTSTPASPPPATPIATKSPPTPTSPQGLGTRYGSNNSIETNTTNPERFLTIRPSVFRQYSTIYMLLSDGHGGHVSADRLVQRLRLSPSTANAMLEQADTDGNGVLDFDEFVQFMLRKDVTALLDTASPQSQSSSAPEANTTNKRQSSTLSTASVASTSSSSGQPKNRRGSDLSEWSPTDGELRRYRMLFELIDQDKNNVLDLDELTLALHLDQYMKTLLQKIVRTGPPTSVSFSTQAQQPTINFETFVTAMHDYEAMVDADFLRPTRDGSSFSERSGSSSAQSLVIQDINAALSDTTTPSSSGTGSTNFGFLNTLFDFLAANEAHDNVSTQRVLRLLESAMHSGKHGLSVDDYNLHVALQRRLLSSNGATVSMERLASMVKRFPTCVFMTPSFQAEYTRQDFIVVTDETGRRQSLLEVEMTQLQKLRTQNDAQLVDSLTPQSRAMYEKVFDYIDADGSGTITKDEVASAVQEMMESGIKEGDLDSLFALLEAIDGIQEHEMRFPQFVRVLEACGDISFFDQIIVEEPNDT